MFVAPLKTLGASLFLIWILQIMKSNNENIIKLLTDVCDCLNNSLNDKNLYEHFEQVFFNERKNQYFDYNFLSLLYSYLDIIIDAKEDRNLELDNYTFGEALSDISKISNYIKDENLKGFYNDYELNSNIRKVIR